MAKRKQTEPAPIITVYEDRPGEAYVAIDRFVSWQTALDILAVIFADMKKKSGRA